jgi:hypothetical protein
VPRKPAPPKAPMSDDAARAAAISALPTGVVGAKGRYSVDRPNQLGLLNYFIAPAGPDDTWRSGKLDDRTLSRMNPTQLMQLLVDVSPDVSRALWDHLRLCNPGWECYVYKPGTETEDQAGTDALHAFWDLLESYYGTIDVTINRILIGGWLRGAFFGELVLGDASGAGPNAAPPRRSRIVPIDIATPDPASIRFKVVDGGDRGPVSQMGQWQAGQFIPLDRPTIRYIPVDPLPGIPYGRPIVTPSLFSAVFLLGILHDIRRVVQQQGYPRIDVSIDAEALMKMMPNDVRNNSAAQKAWIDATVQGVTDYIRGLQPDDTYVHMSAISVNRPVGAVDSSSLGAIDSLIKSLERFLTRALKTMPLLMGTTDGVSEANANRQWEIHAAGVKSLQHPVECMLEWFFTLALQVQGITADVEFRFGELRAAEMLRDAQTEALVIMNNLSLYLFGIQDQEAFSMAVTGNDPARPFPIAIPSTFAAFTDPDAPTPEPAAPDPNAGNPGATSDPTQAAADAADVQADPGSNRQTKGIRNWRRDGRGIESPGVRFLRPGRKKPGRFGSQRVPGADAPMLDLPLTVDYSTLDRAKLAAIWDLTHPDFAGLLDAASVE